MIINPKTNYDERRESVYDIFPEINGQINISYVQSTESIIGLHKHKIQTDFLFCVKGSFKVCLVDDSENSLSPLIEYIYLSEREPKVLVIKPGIWHGFRAIKQDSVMLYWLSHKYNKDDEYKINPFSFDINWNIVSK